MTSLAGYLPYIQIILSIALIALILLQQTGSELGGAFGGGGDGGNVSHTRRGFEKTVFHLTIVVAILFALSAIVALVV